MSTLPVDVDYSNKTVQVENLVISSGGIFAPALISTTDFQTATLEVSGLATLATVAQSGATVGTTSPPVEGVTSFTFSSDANKVATQAQYKNGILLVTGAVISATRNIQYPLVAGAVLIVDNQEGHSVQIIGPTGTGVTVATTKRAIVYCDGTNWNRVTPDT